MGLIYHNLLDIFICINNIYKMVALSTFINENIYILLKNFDDIEDKNFIFKKIIKISKFEFTDLELKLFLDMENIKVVIELLNFWLSYLPFTEEYVLFNIIYYLMIDNIKYIRKLLIIGNITEVFHFIKGMFYRNLYGYYNVVNDIFSYDLKSIEQNIIIEGFVKGDELLKDLNKNYEVIHSLVSRNRKNKSLNFDFINDKQKNNFIFKKLCNKVIP